MNDDSNRDESINRHFHHLTTQQTAESAFWIGLAQKCPHCGIGKLFSGLLDITKECPRCSFDLSKSDPGDGPAFFVITIMGFLVVLLALWVNAAFQPPLWVHALLWIPFTLGGSIILLRITKALLIAYQHHLKAGPT